MRRLVVVVVMLAACGGESGSPAPSTSTSTSPSPSTSTSTSPSPEAAPSPEADPALCDRVAPCAQAFAAVAPAELSAPALVASEQLDHSLAESPARAAACRDALASFRADLERLALDVPDACREAAPGAD